MLIPFSNYKYKAVKMYRLNPNICYLRRVDYLQFICVFRQESGSTKKTFFGMFRSSAVQRIRFRIRIYGYRRRYLICKPSFLNFCRMAMDKYKTRVCPPIPTTVDELLNLPGIIMKIILSKIYVNS
jgi:hypothetical protein